MVSTTTLDMTRHGMYKLVASSTGCQMSIRRISQREFSRNEGQVIVGLLAVPCKPPGLFEKWEDDRDYKATWDGMTSLQRAAFALANRRSRCQGVDRLSRLPCEVLHIIFDELNDSVPMAYLGFTSRYMWKMAERALHRYFAKSLGKYAGTRIMLVKLDSFPPGFEPIRFMFGRRLSESPRHEIWDLVSRSQRYNLDRFPIHYSYTPHSLPGYPGEDIYYGNNQYFRPNRHIGYTLNACAPVLSPSLDMFYDVKRTWVLRNLTTKEYVRGDAIALRPDFIHGPFIEGLGFGEVVIMRTAWKHASLMPHPQDGKWAGHCLDIRPWGVREKRTGDNTWKDVSEEIVKQLDEVFSERLGRQWRENIIRQITMPDRPRPSVLHPENMRRLRALMRDT
ncbi:hypothetical protein VFPPC_04078 [Pochonia chlamydosporia 170]|uniref:Uncharacterized protein n=1 Tax=Pochonia chlamydosporia 170 TaxID=1380566 RepID=A0A179FQ63_METCM|nr:hypothetical protein VFPPC_04078 [Pochonia chlamydosporia 170]OAQ67724.1 hypothetical protein VFPPC_04078 [Pochonia chlamydosporia 170]